VGSRLIDRFDAACFQPAWAGICRREYIGTRASDMMMSDHGFDAHFCGGIEVLGFFEPVFDLVWFYFRCDDIHPLLIVFCWNRLRGRDSQLNHLDPSTYHKV